MLSYCLKCRKNTKSKNSNIAKIKNERMMLLSKCAVCDTLIYQRAMTQYNIK